MITPYLKSKANLKGSAIKCQGNDKIFTLIRNNHSNNTIIQSELKALAEAKGTADVECRQTKDLQATSLKKLKEKKAARIKAA